MHVLTSEAQDEEADAAGSVRLAIRLSLLANFVLAGLQVRPLYLGNNADTDYWHDQLYAAISSLSLSLFATCIDAGEHELFLLIRLLSLIAE